LFEQAQRNLNMSTSMQDYSGFSSRGSAHFSTGLSSNSTTILRGRASVGTGCGAFDFATSFREAFESIPSVIAGYAEAVVQNIPMLGLCWAWPTGCDLVKHFQALMNVLIQARYGQCQQIQAAAMYTGMRLRNDEVSRCLEEQQRSGATINQALQRCHQAPTSLRLPDGSRGVEVHIVQDTLRAAGASTEVQQLAQQALGDITLRAGDALGVEAYRPSGALLGLYETHKQQYDAALDTAATEFREHGTLSESTLRAVSTPGQPLPRVAVEALAAMQGDPARYAHHRGQLSTAAALSQLTWRCQELEATMAASLASNPNVSDEERRAASQLNEQLRRELAHLMQKVDVRDKYQAPAIDNLLREYTALQETATRYGIGAPAITITPSRYGPQLPMGYTK
jgi:hypothetical protein